MSAMQQQQIKTKPRPDLTSVTPMMPAPEPEAMDTTTPMDISVLPFTMKEIPKWGPWLLARLNFLWPHFTASNYIGLMGQHMADSGTLLIKARKALLMAVATREAMNPRPVIDVVFIFKHVPEDEEQNKDVRLLVRHMENWGRSMGARGTRVLYPAHVDLTLSRAREIFVAEDVKYLGRDLDK